MTLACRILSLTPVMTAPLDQFSDNRRKESSTALKPMTAGGDSLKHPQHWTTTLNDLSGTLHWIPGLQSLMQVSRTPQRGLPHTPSLYPTPTLTEHSLSPPPSPCLCQFLCHLTHPDASWLTQQSPLLEDLCGPTNHLLKAGPNV